MEKRKQYCIWLNYEVALKLQTLPKADKWRVINEYLAKSEFNNFDSVCEKFTRRKLCTMYLVDNVHSKVQKIGKGRVAATMSNILKGLEA